MQLKFRYKVSGDWRGDFSTFERALSRAREMRNKLKESFSVIEVDQFGNETPVAVCLPGKRAKKLAEPKTNYARGIIDG